MDNNWEELEQHSDDISGTLLPQKKVQAELKELKAKTKEASLAHELFSAMLLLETVKSLLSFAVTDGFRRTVGGRYHRHLSCSFHAET